MNIKKSWRILLKHKIVIIVIIIIFSVSITSLSIFSPSVISFIFPQEHIQLVDVKYPSEVYRSDNVPISVSVANVGGIGKDVLIEVSSKDSPTLPLETLLNAQGPVTNLTIFLPVKTRGEQAFTVKVYWIGFLGIYKEEQQSVDKTFKVLAADYEVTPSPSFANIAENFDWSLQIVNVGNTAAEHLIVQVVEKDPLSIIQPDSKTIDNFGVNESRKITFSFTVPHDANEGDCTIKVNFITTYSSGVAEVLSHDFTVKLQKSPTQVQIENTQFWLLAIAGLIAAALFLFSLSKRKH